MEGEDVANALFQPIDELGGDLKFGVIDTISRRRAPEADPRTERSGRLLSVSVYVISFLILEVFPSLFGNVCWRFNPQRFSFPLDQCQ